jgi:NitT/TauT family transport system permease protein
VSSEALTAPQATQPASPIDPSAAPRPPRRRRIDVGVLLGRIGVFVGFVALWEWAVVTERLSGLLFDSASEVGRRLASDVASIVTGGSMREHFLVTTGEIYIAFAICAIGGVAMGVVIHEITFVNKVLYPYIVAFSATPRVAIAPLVLIWFGFDMASKVVIGVMIAIFPTLVATLAGLSAADEDKIRLMRSLGASRAQTFTKVRLWEALPYIFAGLQTSVVLVTVGVVVGEFTGGRRGLGVLITIYQDSLEIAGTFSAILLLSALGLFNYYVMQYLRGKAVFWKGDSRALV